MFKDVASCSLVRGSEVFGDAFCIHFQRRSADFYMRTQPCYSEGLCLESGQEERLSCVLSSSPPGKQAFVYFSRYFILYSFICMFVCLLSPPVVLSRLPFVLTLPPLLLFSIISFFLYVRIIFSQFRFFYLLFFFVCCFTPVFFSSLFIP